MSETHINVYFNNVQEAEAQLEVAKGKVSTAKAELEAKKRDIGYEEEEESTPDKVEVKNSKPRK